MDRNRLGVAATAALAPAAWGTTYLVTTQLLPEGRPLLLAVVRALPAGLLLLLMGRRLPRGRWWGRAAVLGMLNIGLFFPLVFVGAYRLPGGVAATIGAIQPLLVAGFSVGVLGLRPGRRTVLAGLAGVGGVALLVLKSGARLDGVGIAAMVAGIALMAMGTVLTRRWGRPEGATLLDLTAWQLLAGSVFLVPLAAVVEGAPPALSATNLAGFAYLGLFGTAIGYVLWFRGIERLGAGPASFLGLINPVVATVGGLVVLGQTLTPWQVLGLVIALGALVAGQSPARAPKPVAPTPAPTPAPERATAAR
ncbi:EamA family transporter [Streptomyces sp. SP17BM10]|uniref:EamA family transporter n=1 Tax=Streptomyces sp. SP17BM10 TaxID=3002530 RepID=UPI002E75ABC4|nr:EamA family transporter [Streptomyces sp. SP17BM10]MEE1783294.1 EamA family transporter [Streptomyces sp. SP17BM10]